MQLLFEMQIAIRDFLELGGPVLMVIAANILIMWILIVERTLYFRSESGRWIRETVTNWEGRPERKSWHALAIRDGLLSQFTLAANGPIPIIKTLVVLCPLLGLMGTVTGMIEVFDVLATAGTANARSMAAGVSKATIPTMAGMVGALSGVFASTLLSRKAKTEVERLGEALALDH